MKSQASQFLPFLKLALAWDRFEDIKQLLFTKSPFSKMNFYEELMQQVLPYAIEYNNTEFVNTFLNCQMSLQDYLTKKGLCDLYSKV